MKKKILILASFLIICSLLLSSYLLISSKNNSITNTQKTLKEVDESFYVVEKEKRKVEQKDAPSTEDIWKILLETGYRPDGLYGNKPIFGPKQEALDGKNVTISGYMYLLEQKEKQNFFMLSYYPISRCFFCGGAGPQSIIEVNSKVGITNSKKRIQITGQLKLNKDDSERLFFVINDAKEKKF